MVEYKYVKVKGYDQKKFTEDGHTMFETDVLNRLKRLAYLEDQIIKGDLCKSKKGVFCGCGKPYSQKDLQDGMCHKCNAPTGYS